MTNTTPTALILAAGYGSRISSVTEAPKCLIPINHQSLLERHIRAFEKWGLSKVVMVVGHKSFMIEEEIQRIAPQLEVEFIHNPEYREKGNTYSMQLGLEAVKGPVLIMDADIAYETSIMGDFLADERENLALIGEALLTDIECAKTLVDANGDIQMFIDKRAITESELERFRFVGEAVGVIRLSDRYRQELLADCVNFMAQPENVLKNWEHVFNLFLPGRHIQPQYTDSNHWIEIDNAEDYARAQEIFA